MSDETKEVLYKIVITGEPSVGKTSTINRYCHGFFSDTYKCTIGVDFALKQLKRKKKAIKLQLWDVAGQEKFNTVTHIYYRNSVGAIVVFDLCQISTLSAVKQWKNDLDEKVFLYEDSEECCNVPTILLANKYDRKGEFDKRIISELEAFCKQHKFIKYFLTSAKTGEGIPEAMDFLVDRISEELEKIDKKEQDDPNVFKLGEQQLLKQQQHFEKTKNRKTTKTQLEPDCKC